MSYSFNTLLELLKIKAGKTGQEKEVDDRPLGEIQTERQGRYLLVERGQRQRNEAVAGGVEEGRGRKRKRGMRD